MDEVICIYENNVNQKKSLKEKSATKLAIS